MNFKDLQQNWDRLGNLDPFWAILSEPDKRKRGWDREEFFKTGEAEIAWLMEYVASLPIKLGRGEALDFGCGVGRITQALCRHFERCIGVDVADSMVRLANEHNRHGGRCRYCLNLAEDLRLFSDNRFDFVYSNIVLQHMEPQYSQRYIGEFLRIIKNGGLAIFQIPSERIFSQTEGMLNVFSAEIAIIAHPSDVKIGAKMNIRARVANTGQWPWPAEGRSKHPVRLGNHWLNSSAHMIQMDDARAILAAEVPPSASVELSISACAPIKSGDYLLELDMVQENIAWFKDRGSKTVSFPVNVHGTSESTTFRNHSVEPAVGNPVPDSATEEPAIEMHCVKKEAVLETIAASNGKVVDIMEYGSAGPEYVSFLYCITK